MEIEGKIIAVLPERSGTSQNGPWKVAGYVIETQETYPKRMFFEVRDGRDGRIARLNIQLGKIMRVWWDINVREYEGKWYNTITAYDAREVANSAVEQQAESNTEPPQSEPTQPPIQQPCSPVEPQPAPVDGDDLPF